MPMRPENILASIWFHRKAVWKSTFAKVAVLRHRTGLDLNDSQVSHMLAGKPKPAARRALNADVLKKIAACLNTPDLFASASEQEVLNHIDLAHPGAARPLALALASWADSETLLVPDVAVKHKRLLHAHEEAVMRFLVKSLTDDDAGKIVSWTYEEPVGASFLAVEVASHYSDRIGAENTYIVRPHPRLTQSYLADTDETRQNLPGEDGPTTVVTDNFPANLAYLGGLAQLATRLGVEPNTTQSAKLILEKLEQTRGVLFVLQADALTMASPSNCMQDLLRVAQSSGVRPFGQPPPIVIVGSAKFPKFKAVDLEAKLRDLCTSAIVPDDVTRSRISFFKQEWRRFCEARGYSLPDDVGTRLKRAKWYYESLHEKAVWPISIRMRAYLASNYAVLAYFDPTGGWSRLASCPVEALPIEIRCHLDEVVVHVRSLKRDRRIPQLRALRWVATSLYWLTDTAVIDLKRSHKKYADIESFQETVDSSPSYFRTGRGVDPANRIYKADLVTKAVVQEKWMRQAPAERSKTHYVIAKRLHMMRDNAGALAVEFPLYPHWGKSKIHLIAECIRHLMRACELADDKPGGEVRNFSPFPADFPPPATVQWRFCDPYVVVNYCFGTLFWKELNENSEQGSAVFNNRKLARAHGLYSLTAELLQLMSLNGILGNPHWALHPDHHPRYYREVAFAQLDLGNLSEARENFSRLIDSAAELPDKIGTLNYQLDLAIALMANNDLHAAEDLLARVEFAYEDLAAAHPPIAAVDSNSRATRGKANTAAKDSRLDKLSIRIVARQAHLQYLRGAHGEALRRYRALEARDSTAIRREVAHVYIATLGAVGGEENLKKAMVLAARQHVTNSGKELHHEALGFRIAKAHAFRKAAMPLEVVEAELDTVYSDILEHGCSERTYLAFLLEAGRTVVAFNRHARAYTAYLRPCFDRASSRGYLRLAETARHHALICLAALREQMAAMYNPADWPRTLDTMLDGRGIDVPTWATRDADPKYSYDIYGKDMWLPRLSTDAGLLTEMRDLQSPIDVPVVQPTETQLALAAD